MTYSGRRVNGGDGSRKLLNETRWSNIMRDLLTVELQPLEGVGESIHNINQERIYMYMYMRKLIRRKGKGDGRRGKRRRRGG